MLDRVSPEPMPAAAPPGRAAEAEVLIVGSGFGGITMAAGLKAAGMEDFLVIEKDSEVGGTWRDNAYPGCACDVAAHLYSLSFAQNADWTRLLATQSELQAYIVRVVDDLGLRPKIRFNTEMARAKWDEAAALWRVTTRAGDVISARVLVSGIGALHVPSIPKLPGAESFEGVSFHSARWRHDYDLTGKRVAVIGTGASAIQFMPQIAPDVAQLHVFQRTAPWILPKLDREIGPKERWMLRNVQGWRSLFRRWLYCTYEIRVLGFMGNRMLVEKAEKVARKHLELQVANSELRRKLTPNYRIGCKRVLLADDYYPALTRANVELVTDAIAEIRTHSIVTKDGREREIDAIIYGTGFHVARALRRLDVQGRGGRALADVWKEAIESYYGITVSGFPNFFMLLGPNTALGHNSVVIMIEAQVTYIMSALKQMKACGIGAIDVKRDVQHAFYKGIQRKLEKTQWQAGGCHSWYQDDGGHNVAIWPGFTFDYIRRTRHAALTDYEAVG